MYLHTLKNISSYILLFVKDCQNLSVRYVKSLITIVQKQQIILKISLQKLAYFLLHLQSSRTNNSKRFRIKNAKFSGYCSYMNTNK